MKNGKLITVLSFYYVLLGWNTYAQIPEVDSSNLELKKNIIYVTLGFAGLYGAANANYERIIGANKSGFFKYYSIRAGGGYHGAAYGGPVGPHGIAGITGLTGAKKSHLEIGLGLTAMYDKEAYKSGVSDAEYLKEPEPSKADYVRIWPAVSIGYRHQKPGDNFVFRTGASIPESFYLSLGFCF